MKKLIAVIFSALCLLTFFSCSKTGKDVASDINEKVCSRLKSKSVSADYIITIKKQVKDELQKSRLMSYEQYLSESKPALEPCFRTIRFSHSVANNNPGSAISGSGAPFLRLDNNQYDIKLDERESTGFILKLKIIAYSAHPDTVFKNLKGSLTLFDSNGSILDNYNVYLSPDIQKMLHEGRGETVVTIALSPIWNSLSEDPFDLAAASMNKMQKAARFDLSVNLNGDEDTAMPAGGVTDDKNDVQLNQLDALVNNYAQAIKKALNDDLEAMASYPDIYKKAEEKLTSLKTESPSFSPQQKARLAALEKKLRQAAAQIR